MLGGHRQTPARLVGRDALGGPAQRTGDPDIAVVGVAEPELQAQPQPVAHGQRDLEPVRGGDHDMDAVGQPGVGQFGDPRQQRIPGVEGVGVVPAERVEVVDHQEHLAVAVLVANGARAAFLRLCSSCSSSAKVRRISSGCRAVATAPTCANSAIPAN
jgi:hypothetical protein